MATHFDRWEKDPFFYAAEEVQESANRMESTYRTWLHSEKDTSGFWNIYELRRDLQTTLGTTKWQLEDFEKVVNPSNNNSSDDDSRDRHRDFMVAMESQIKKVEKSLNESAVSLGKPPLPWVQLDEGECNELALFLLGPSNVDKNFGRVLNSNQRADSLQDNNLLASAEHSQESPDAQECAHLDAKEKLTGHRRTASASADIGSWNILVSDDSLPLGSSNEKSDPPPHKVPSFSGFLNTMESATTKLKWSRNGYRKLKLVDRSEEADALPCSQQIMKGLNSGYERNKSCLEGGDYCYDKQLYGWYGAIQRQLQRSQYHVQYCRPVQVVLSMFLLFVIVIVTVQAV
ncbi:hypothetical protein LIER_24166 [Lithospermum erythrorhizon]|uniref:Syntaxin 6/10/61 N-terminal domain-containing protein n=1 Tax=Lithospermum erythrorhizon TaxID=34254 RepID=A0AAV3R4D4_LITER